jgi:hypothetical protein
VFEGGFFAGSAKAILKFKALFWERHNQYIRDYFIGKDQQIMNSIAYDSDLNVLCLSKSLAGGRGEPEQ